MLAQIQARREKLRAEGALPAVGSHSRSSSESAMSACQACGGLGWYRLAVPLGHLRFGEAVRCECKREEDLAAAAARAQKASNLRGDLLEKTFDGYVASPETAGALNSMRSFAEDPRGWVALVGSYGCGKTHLLAACANALLATGRHPLYVEVPAWLDYVRGGYDEEGVALGKTGQPPGCGRRSRRTCCCWTIWGRRVGRPGRVSGSSSCSMHAMTWPRPLWSRRTLRLTTWTGGSAPDCATRRCAAPST